MFYWVLVDMCLPKFDIYQGTVALNCFKSQDVKSPDVFETKKVLLDARSEIHFVQHNIIST